MSSLLPCPTCARHVRRSESGCPFCGAALALPSEPERAIVMPRLGRAATFAFGAAIATVAAGCTDTGAPVPLYGAAAVDTGVADGGPVDSGLLAMYGGPPIDAGNDAGGNVGPAYGAPVIDGGFNDVDMGTSNADYGGPPHT